MLPRSKQITRKVSGAVVSLYFSLKSSCKNPLIHPELQLGVHGASICPNRFDGFQRLREHMNASLDHAVSGLCAELTLRPIIRSNQTRPNIRTLRGKPLKRFFKL